jgi:hypothetical protein
MKDLTLILAQVAALLALTPGCTVSQSSCDGFVPNVKDIEVAPDVACAILGEGGASAGVTVYFSQGCTTACGPGFGGCTMPADYVQAFVAAQSDAGTQPDAEAGADVGASDGGLVTACPRVPANVKVHCSSFCEGRRTDGVDEPTWSTGPSLGAYFAACSYLEAVSAHAFARLRGELSAHGAPPALIERARLAIDEEARHAELTASLARRFGVEPARPAAPSAEVRSLFELARENAVEGCVRETYGAALALVRAARAGDAEVRVALASLAHDECGHAELSWATHAWATERLDEAARTEIRRAMRAAVDELAGGGDDVLFDDDADLAGLPTRAERRRLLAQLDERVFRAAA